MATLAKVRDPIDALGIKLISADNHINEPRNLFVDRFPKHLKDKAPRKALCEKAVRVFRFDV